MTAPKAAEVEARTIDLSSRGWGQNYNILSVADEGKRLRLAVWSTPIPMEGDYLILADGDQTTRYQAASVDLASGVRDMTFVEARFAPRFVAHPSKGE